MKLLDRRRFLLILGGSAAGVGASSSVSATSGQTLWMLDPAWGTPLWTDTGSDVKTSCRGRACHLAAPHRFFLTESDARSGRLHPCCLAQPVAVSVCVDLNRLMPYHRARHGGVDGRCPELPADIRSALYGAAPCLVAPGRDGPASPSSPPVDPPADAPSPAPVAVPAPPPASPPSPTPSRQAASHGVPAPAAALPATGADVATTVVAAGVLTAAGAVAVAASRRPEPEPAPASPQ